METIIALLCAYLLGAIPFGVIAAKLCGVDIFKIGSGSTGTTNVIRACGKSWGLTVLVLDVLKGTAAMLIGILTFPNAPLLAMSCGLLAIIGHSASVFIKFKGGKSAATGVGLLLAINWLLALLIGLVVFIIRQTTGYQSVATLVGALLAVVLFTMYAPAYSGLVIIGAVFVWIKHIPNIKRLFNGTETRITKK
jgi:acyl phosphate:glycerol-3-phosphate acyltransferase